MQLLENIQPPSRPNPEREKALTSLELFAGAGGLALGTHLAGFRHLGLVEWDELATQTLRENSQNVLDLNPNLVFHSDVRSFNYEPFAGKVDLLSGGPPCQPFSMSGRGLGPNDHRNMFPAFLDAIAVIMPKSILIENVKGLLRETFRDYYSYILKRLQFPLCRIRQHEMWNEHYQRLCSLKDKDFADHEQYVVTFQLVNTADYGVPQRRERVLISAFRRDLGVETFHLRATHTKEALLFDQWITGNYWEKHNISSYDYLGPANKKVVERLGKELFPPLAGTPWRTVRDALADLPAPVLRGNREEIPNHIQHPGAREYANHKGSIFDYPAKVLKAGTHGTPGGENIVRLPNTEDVRYFTTREAARLQTFPDEWHFHGTWGACIRQLGNAVPVEVIKLISIEISQRLISVLK